MSNKEEKFFDCYNLFTHIENAMLRDWNRLNTFFNITLQVNGKKAREYAANFSKDEKDAINTMYSRMKEIGRENLLKEVKASIA